MYKHHFQRFLFFLYEIIMCGREILLMLACNALLILAQTSSSFGWQRVQPMRVSAQGGSMLIISGIFNKSSAYTCRFESTNPFAIGQVLSAVARPDSDGNLACTAPTWKLGAQEVILSVLITVGDTGSDAVDVRGVLPGPEIGDRISYVAVWRTKSEATGAAQGGTSISIDGFGFDKNDADYVCKFLCIHSSCSSLPAQRFAVSEVSV
jgi:hypothetical protein